MTFQERASRPLDELHSHQVQRRCRRPRGRVENRGPGRIEVETGQDVVARSEPSTRQSTLGMPTSRGASLDGIDRAGADEVAHAPAVDEEEAMPAAHRRLGPVVVVLELAGDAVEHLDAARAARQPRPQEVGASGRRRIASTPPRRGEITVVPGSTRVVDRGDVRAGLARGRVEAHARDRRPARPGSAPP